MNAALLPPRAALAEKLRWYSPAAAGLAALAAPSADGQVVYTDLDPDVVVREDSFRLDLDLDGDPELLFRERFLPPWTQGETALGPDRLTDFVGNLYLSYGVPYYCHAYNARWDALGAGVVVGPDTPRLEPVDACLNWSEQTFASFEWINTGPHFMGLRFQRDGGAHHFAWIRLNIRRVGGPHNLELRIRDYAYDATPEAPITTGDQGTPNPAVTLAGSVNQTVFPAEGGTLRFTATVTNTTAEPRPLDLWVVARRNGDIAAVRRLGSGTLPPGATVTRTVSTRVPAAAPAGAYDLAFHVGLFPGVVDTEAFTITKEASARGGGAGAEVLLTEPVAGDLFAEASAQTSGLAVAHALSAPTPNPSSGRAAMTLSVAEPQRVTVAVYDALGRRVALLHDGPLDAGAAHRLVFDGSGLPAGVYAVRAVGEVFADARTLTLTR